MEQSLDPAPRPSFPRTRRKRRLSSAVMVLPPSRRCSTTMLLPCQEQPRPPPWPTLPWSSILVLFFLMVLPLASCGTPSRQEDQAIHVLSSHRDLQRELSAEYETFFSDEPATTSSFSSLEDGSTTEDVRPRHLITSPQAVDPVFEPGPGTFITAIGVLLTANDGDLIQYTLTWGLLNHTKTEVVPSGSIIHIEQPSFLRAFTLANNASTLGHSNTVRGFYHIPFVQHGAAYLVPYHNQLPAYSGKLVRVNLLTNLLSYVRIHNILTDFSDYYSFQGQGPYKKGMLHTNDLSSFDPELVGFQGGFSAHCGGEWYGFLVPYFDSTKYSGKAVRIHGSHYVNVTSGSRCNRLSGKCAFQVVDFTKVAPRLAGFAGGFSSGCYAYFVPYFNGYEFSSRVVRVHAANFTAANASFIDLRDYDPELAGFFGGFAYRDYGYLSPYRNVRGPVGGTNTRFTCDGFKDVSMVNTQATNGGDHLEPNFQGKFVRFRLDNFSSSNVEVLDLTTYDPDLRGFSGGFVVGNQAILVPYRNRDLADNQGFFSKVVKVDLDDFKTVTIMDLSHKSQALRGFVGGFAYGKYGILVPYSNGQTQENFQGRHEFGTVVRIDVSDFRLEAVKTIDLPTIKRQQVPNFPEQHLRGFIQGFASGRHAYLVPYFNGARSGILARIDMADFALLSDLQAQGNDTDVYNGHDGVQIVDLSLLDPALVGFSGGFVLPW